MKMFSHQISGSYSVQVDAASNYPINFVPQLHPKKHNSVQLSPFRLWNNYASSSSYNQLNKSESDGKIESYTFKGKRKITLSLSLLNNSTSTDRPVIEIKPLSLAFRITTDNNSIGKKTMMKKNPAKKKKKTTILLGLQLKKCVGKVHL